MPQTSLTAIIAGLSIAATAALAQAATVAFVPPNDPTGQAVAANSNGGFAPGRGDVFSLAANTTIDSVGLYADFTNMPLTYKIWDIPTFSGVVDTNATLLATGSNTVSTSGLAWTDFTITPLTLQAGHNYHVEFFFDGEANQNFFYDNDNIAFTQGVFTLVDGTEAGNPNNSVMPAIRVNTVNATPLPSAAWTGLIGCAMGAAFHKKFTRKKFTAA